MKFKGILSICLAGIAFSAAAQTHVEGEEYYKADQFANAKDLLVRSLSNPQTDKAVSNYYLGMLALRDNKDAEAQKYFNDGINTNPEYAYNYVGLGALQLAKGDEKQAEVYFKDADKRSKKDASLQIAIARAYNEADPVKYEKQITKYVEKARKANANEADIYVFEGDRYKEQKNVGMAGNQYEYAAEKDPNATQAYVKYANLFTLVNPQYSIDMLSKLLSLNPNSALAQRELANAYYNNKDYAKAASEYGKYVQNPSHFKSDEDRYSFLLFYGGDYKKGYDFASQLLASNPSNFTAKRYQFMNAAQIPDLADKMVPMAESLLADHKADPKTNRFAAIDYTLIADELAKAKRSDEAITVLQEAIVEMPEMASFNKDLAMKYVDANNITKAAEAFREYVKKSEEPGYNDYNQQATFSFYAGVENMNNPDIAKTFFNEVIENADKMANILPDNYKPKMLKGDVAKQTAQSEDDAAMAAQPLYEEAVALLEASPNPEKYARDAKTLYMYLGNYYVKKNDVAKAKEYYNKYLSLDPENEAVRKYVDSL